MKKTRGLVGKALLLVFIFIVVAACHKETPPMPAPLDPGFSTYTVYGQIIDEAGNPMRGLELRVQTSFKEQTLRTDSAGEYQATSFQGYEEPTRFEFVNAIGDTVHYQTALTGRRNQRLDFVMDQKGSVSPLVAGQ